MGSHCAITVEMLTGSTSSGNGGDDAPMAEASSYVKDVKDAVIVEG